LRGYRSRLSHARRQILGFFHENAVNLYNATCDLRFVCFHLSER
jgi:hypothetical protein